MPARASVVLAAGIVYLVMLAYSQPLFAHQLTSAGISVHSTRPIPDAMTTTLERVRARFDRSSFDAGTRDVPVFICDSRWLFARFARQNHRVGGVADWLVGHHVFLREGDMQNDRLIGPGALERRRMPLDEVLANPPLRETELMALSRW